jgi:outer membrane translocation and assembly module TamA
MLMSAEIRWIPANAVDMALFYDAGKVTPRRRDFSFKQLKSDVGIGIRFHGLFVTPLRVDVAVGNEGWKLVISGSAVYKGRCQKSGVSI